VVNHYRHASIQIGDKAFYQVKAKDLEMAANNLEGNPSSLAPLPISEDHAQQQDPGQTENCMSPLSDTVTEEGGGSTWQEEQKKTQPQGVVSDSTDPDDDADGGEHTGHKSKGGHGAQGPKHDSSAGPPSVRFPVKRRRKRAKRKRKTIPYMDVKVGDRVCVEIISTCTTVDVIWQDRTKDTAVLSTDLVPVFHLDEHEFFPGDYVNDKRGTIKINSSCHSYIC
jgi:ubiquitin-conjugating enzyme E2 O